MLAIIAGVWAGLCGRAGLEEAREREGVRL
jgi:hypothetical protein